MKSQKKPRFSRKKSFKKNIKSLNLLKVFKFNLSDFLRVKPDHIKFIKDDRFTQLKQTITSKYQIGIYISNKTDFKKIQQNIRGFIAKYYSDCFKMTNHPNVVTCVNNKITDSYRIISSPKESRVSNFSIFYPTKYQNPQYYMINHGIGERFLVSRAIYRKQLVLDLINTLGNME